MQQGDLIPHLFRTEFRKITAVLCRHFGLEHIEIAEDIAAETFLAALENWPYRGAPEKPAAWLYTVAKNKTKTYLQRRRLFTGKIAEQLKTGNGHIEEPEIDWSDKNITDSQLQMLFAVCHPAIPPEAQAGLALRILCGFGIDEIAHAFLTSKETIHKRLYRAKEKLREEKVVMEIPHAVDINERLAAVLTTLYLLYNEGYYSESKDVVLREEFCLEAMRLTFLLIDFEATNLPPVNALYALMCFHASRFPARKNDNGELVLYQDQDESLWDKNLIANGVYYLRQAAQGNKLSQYHLEATIAYWHTIKEDTTEKWENILQLYNRLLVLAYSPVAALNRTYALSKVYGNAEAIKEAEKLQLTGNHYYYTLLGELYKNINKQISRQHFEQALTLAKTQADKQSILKKLPAIIL